MKNLVIGFLFTTFLCGTINGQKSGGNPTRNRTASVPEIVKSNFEKENPGIEPKWKNEDTNYRAEYIDAVNLPHIRVYDKSGAMVYRDDVMESYPAPIQTHFTTKYPGEGFVIWSRIDSKGTLSYYSYRNSDTLIFDKDGNLVSPKKNKGRLSDSISVIEPTKN
jgi:hypothetical protein